MPAGTSGDRTPRQAAEKEQSGCRVLVVVVDAPSREDVPTRGVCLQRHGDAGHKVLRQAAELEQREHGDRRRDGGCGVEAHSEDQGTDGHQGTDFVSEEKGHMRDAAE